MPTLDPRIDANADKLTSFAQPRTGVAQLWYQKSIYSLEKLAFLEYSFEYLWENERKLRDLST
jgi:hypothetical protein